MAVDLRRRFIRALWAAHNDSPAVRAATRSLLENLGSGRGLNLACGDTRFDPRMVNFDLARTGAVDVVGDALALPFPDSSFALVLSQETVEHIADPFRAVREMARVLRPGGTLYLQAPFVIGYHPGPEDYWRFSRAGMRRLVEQAGLDCRQVEPAVGAGTAMYRIAVEFFAGCIARFLPALYLPVKAAGSILFFPFVWWNGFLAGGRQSDRIPGGYFAIGVKKETP
ncbi:MAG: class I SAM-dependent methyltransferase [Anaerolineales bacterium]|nr:class I SAM-dependent methyltransferase [Anaerolineales bacterium]